MRERRTIATLLAALVCAGACGKVKQPSPSGAGGAGGASPILVTVSGAAAPHPLDAALGADADFSQLRVSIVDPSEVILDPSAKLGSMVLDTSMSNCDQAVGCQWTLSGIDISKQNLGLVGMLEDLRVGDARLWVKTGTGMGTAMDLEAVRAAPAPITGRRAFVVSRALEAKLAAFVSAALNETFAAGDLETRGFLIGHVVDKLSSAPTPAGVAGATVSATGQLKIIYPDATFTAAGTATSESGIFLMVPLEAKTVITMFDVVMPPGDRRTWTPHLAGSNPNNAFVIILPADE
jgi:hypothetical protein